MRTILLTLRFLGTAYHGWQVQENAKSIQSTVQDAAEQIIGSRDPITGCSRTDSGVHAEMYCCTLRTESGIDCYRLISALNAKLPPDIAVYDSREVPEDFHPRYSCLSKRYCYQIYNSTSRNPFYDDRAWTIHRPLDAELLDREAKAFCGTHDFTSFSNNRERINDNIRTVMSASVTREGNMIRFRVEADGFLYNMVRIMTGTLVQISEGKREQGSIPQTLLRADRSAAGPTAPACGLFLENVNYGGKENG